MRCETVNNSDVMYGPGEAFEGCIILGIKNNVHLHFPLRQNVLDLQARQHNYKII